VNKLNKLLNNRPDGELITPSPLILQHYGAANGGHAALVACTAEAETNEVISFAENKTKLDRWIISVGFPKRIDGAWVWRLVR